ncbi:MAG: histidinol-phosphatase HisJ family protein [Firmicutes bacterium]|nr:histidinol-phosphatase HisJ family protein [Bacillota bacterium]
MLIRSNPHTHTQFCDGRSTAEEMVLSAIDHGFHTLGFSSHSDILIKNDWCLTSENVSSYINEVKRLQQMYKDQICIRLGLELDLFSAGHIDLSPYEYLIGSVHMYRDPNTGIIYSYDWNPEKTTLMFREAFDCDPIRYARAYFSDVVKLIREVRPLIVGHFDLLLKFNDKLHIIDPDDPVYRKIAMDALHSIMETGAVFEVNVGAIDRGYRKVPYPDIPLLRELCRHHYPVIVSSDCHNAPRIDSWFDEAEELLREIGFRSVLELGPDQLLQEVPLI